ncbi:MAG: methyltransferase [Proteobacteria bacterium]|nr:methyltransferase [Pseudomonadota bacterium]
MAGAGAGYRRSGVVPAPVPRQPRGGAGGCRRAAGRLAVTGAGAAEDFVRANTLPGHAPLVPEIGLFLASEITPIWQATEDWLAARNVAPPFWAFAWPGGQALARRVLDDPALVAGRRVLDFAAGCGLAAIACAHAGAAVVEAAEIDPLAAAAIRLNAEANGAAVEAVLGDVVGAACRWDLILCGDVCYEAPMTAHILPWLRAMASTAEVWLADPGRGYQPTVGLARLADYRVPTTRELEDRTERVVTLFRLLPEAEAMASPDDRGRRSA